MILFFIFDSGGDQKVSPIFFCHFVFTLKISTFNPKKKMASTTLINASTTNTTSTPVEIVGTNSLVVTGAKMKDRVEVYLDDAPAGVLDSPPWVQTLSTGKVDLKVKTRNRSGEAITVKLETTA